MEEEEKDWRAKPRIRGGISQQKCADHSASRTRMWMDRIRNKGRKSFSSGSREDLDVEFTSGGQQEGL